MHGSEKNQESPYISRPRPPIWPLNSSAACRLFAAGSNPRSRASYAQECDELFRLSLRPDGSSLRSWKGGALAQYRLNMTPLFSTESGEFEPIVGAERSDDLRWDHLL